MYLAIKCDTDAKMIAALLIDRSPQLLVGNMLYEEQHSAKLCDVQIMWLDQKSSILSGIGV